MAHPLTDQVKALCPELPPHVLRNLLITSEAISLAGTTNLAVAKDKVPQAIGTAEALLTNPASNYQRLMRFFRDGVNLWKVELHQCLQQITLATIGNAPAKVLKRVKHLTLDGSKWKSRGDKIQFLTLCVVVDNVALPVASQDIAKLGHSSQDERSDFLDEAASHLNLEGMILLGDREYVGIKWFKALKKKRKIDFVVRLKKGIYHEQINSAKGKTWMELHEKLVRCKKCKLVSKVVELGGETYRYIIVRNPKADPPDEDDYVYFLTSLNNARFAAAQYSTRWQIEVTFKHLKSNGFDLEKMRLEGTDKRELMMAILSMLFAIMVHEGRMFYRKKPSARQTKMDHQRGKITLVCSVFRQGYAITKAKLQNIGHLFKYIGRVLNKAKPLVWSHV